MGAKDVIDVVESAYALEGNLQDWAAQVADTFDGTGHGLGTQVIVYSATSKEDLCIEASACAGRHETSFLGSACELRDHVTLDTAMAYLRSPKPIVETLSNLLQAAPEEALEEAWKPLGERGVRDVVGMIGTGRRRSVLLLGCEGRRLALSAAEHDRYAMVATHLAAGLRLRSMLSEWAGSVSMDTVLEHATMVVDPVTSQVVDASPEASSSPQLRALLRRAVRSIDHARSRLRRTDPEAALEVWRGLVDGRYTVVDTFDTDDRRFVVVLPNSPDAPSPCALSERERQVFHYAALGYANKLIAYTLGLETSTVGTHLGRVMRKLRIARKSDLPRMLLSPLVEAKAA